MTLSKSADRVLEVVGQPAHLEPDPVHDDLLRGSFTLRGTAISGTVQVGCQVDSLDPVYAEVRVVEGGPTEVEIDDGFAFQRKNYTVRPGARKKLLVRARFDRPVAEPPAVSYTVADSTVIALLQRTPLELVDGTTYYEGSVVVEGKRLNSKMTVTANLDAHDELPDLCRPARGGRHRAHVPARQLPDREELPSDLGSRGAEQAADHDDT